MHINMKYKKLRCISKKGYLFIAPPVLSHSGLTQTLEMYQNLVYILLNAMKNPLTLQKFPLPMRGINISKKFADEQ